MVPFRFETIMITVRKIAVKMVSRTRALMSLMPAAALGFVMPDATAAWLTVSMTTTAAAIAPMIWAMM